MGKRNVPGCSLVFEPQEFRLILCTLYSTRFKNGMCTTMGHSSGASSLEVISLRNSWALPHKNRPQSVAYPVHFPLLSWMLRLTLKGICHPSRKRANQTRKNKRTKVVRQAMHICRMLFAGILALSPRKVDCCDTALPHEESAFHPQGKLHPFKSDTPSAPWPPLLSCPFVNRTRTCYHGFTDADFS